MSPLYSARCPNPSCKKPVIKPSAQYAQKIKAECDACVMPLWLTLDIQYSEGNA